MVDYVYARHDFIPEHEDEIAFRAGERIEVLLRDDLYSDGWWEVRSLSSSLSTPRFASLSPRSSIPFPTQPRPHGFLEAQWACSNYTSPSSYSVSHVSPLPRANVMGHALMGLLSPLTLPWVFSFPSAGPF